jgi:hypothetical protein
LQTGWGVGGEEENGTQDCFTQSKTPREKQVLSER